MKPSTLLLSASLLGNAALVGVVVWRSAPAPEAPAAAPTAAVRPAAKKSDTGDQALRSALASGSARDLESAGLDPTLARELALGRTFSRLVAKSRTEKASPGDTRWWRNTPGSGDFRERQTLLQREISDALVAAFGEEAGLFSAGNAAKLSFLSPEKREALRRITQDYDEMMAKFSAGGVQLASDRERLKLLREERERDIAALLTPEERLAYEMRTSPTAQAVRARYGDGLESEEDYRKVYALQKAFDEKFPPESLKSRNTPEGLKAFSEAQRQLNDDIRAALGDTAYASLRRATDSDLRTVEALATRLNLPSGATDRIAAARENFAAESQRINADNSVPFPQRRAQIQEVAARARAEVQQVLGAEAAEAYAQRSPWLSMLQGGIAYSTKPQPNAPTAALTTGQTVFPVMPALSGGTTGQRQMIISNTATSTTDVVPGHGDVFLSGSTPGVRENVQVMTFSTTTSETGKPPADGTAQPQTRTIIVTPAPSGTPPPR